MHQYFDKFTKEAKQALIIAQDKAIESKLNHVGTEHILLGILTQKNSLGAHILMNFGVSIENVMLVLQSVGRVPQEKPHSQAKSTQGKQSKAGLSAFAKKAIEEAVKYGIQYNHSYIGTEHLLFALVSQQNTAATVILENMKINPHDVKEQIVQTFEKGKEIQQSQTPNQSQAQTMNPIEFFLSGLQGVLVGNMEKDQYKDGYKQKKENKKQPQTKTPALDYFTSDLVKEAQDGKLDPVIGREKEIERMVSILCRKTKNNPVLIGEPGVGKTAIVEGLAQSIVGDRIPESLVNKRILSLSMTSVIAGTKYRGEFEERIKQILDELATVKNAILFIDEMHTVVGAGSAEGSLDAANILKPSLSRGKVQVIGATTTDEYRKQIENDAALERRFQSILVEEPSISETYDILKGVKKSFEDHHNLLIEEDAIDTAISMSKRYINDRYLPDKAIDLIDEACALKRVNLQGSDLGEVQKHQKELNKIIKKKEEAVSKQDYEHAAELRNKELKLLKLIEEKRSISVPRGKRKKITEDDIGKVVSSMTGVPVTRLVKSDIKRLVNLEKRIKKKIIGQDEAVTTVCKAIRRARAGFADEHRPIGSFIFMGPTGVGKTELVKTLAEEVYNDKNALIKIDMSEFMEKHTTSRLIGTTAGYVGYEDGGQLTEAVRRKPYSILLFDEIEKAHPDIFNLLLQILEDGVLTDSKGRKVDFKNTTIILTSNIGAEKLTKKAAPIGFQTKEDKLKEAETEYQETKSEILEELKKHFKPEFLNRIDKTIVFRALTHKNIKEIVKLHIDMLRERIKDRNLSLEVSTPALEILANESYDPAYGARPVRRRIRELIEDPLTQKYLDGDFKDGDNIRLTKKDNKLVLELAK